MKPWLIHLETSGHSCSVALSEADALVEFVWDDSGDHNAVLALCIKNILMRNSLHFKDLSAISVNIGPGSYTALRIGVVMAKTLSHINHLPLLAIMGLDSLAFMSRLHFPDASHHLPMIDARRNDVYVAEYDQLGQRQQDVEFIQLDQRWLKTWSGMEYQLAISGSGSEKWKRIFPESPVRILDNPLDARMLIPIAWEKYQNAEFSDAETLLPFYLKDPNITVAKKKL